MAVLPDHLVTLQTLRPDFLTAAAECPRLRLMVTGPEFDRVGPPPDGRTLGRRRVLAITCQGLEADGYAVAPPLGLRGLPDGKDHGDAVLYGGPGEPDRFLRLAARAGSHLPPKERERSTNRPMWVVFVLDTIRGHQGNIQAPAAPREWLDYDETPDADPFNLSVWAIDLATRAASAAAEGEAPPRPRLTVDLNTNTVVLDGVPYRGVDPDGLAVVAALLHFKTEGHVRAVPAQKLREKLKNCHHDATLKRWIGQLPSPIRDCIKGKPGAGRWIELPPRPA
jgi:hypothetical protein